MIYLKIIHPENVAGLQIRSVPDPWSTMIQTFLPI